MNEKRPNTLCVLRSLVLVRFYMLHTWKPLNNKTLKRKKKVSRCYHVVPQNATVPSLGFNCTWLTSIQHCDKVEKSHTVYNTPQSHARKKKKKKEIYSECSLKWPPFTMNPFRVSGYIRSAELYPNKPVLPRPDSKSKHTVGPKITPSSLHSSLLCEVWDLSSALMTSEHKYHPGSLIRYGIPIILCGTWI